MSRVVVRAFAMSLDGFGAGARQGLKNPLGERGETLHQWFFPTRTFQEKVLGVPDQGTTGVDDDFARASFDNIGAWIMGRNMFSPGRGAWDERWKGWWGDNPPYHVPAFVLTHHPRADLPMQGGTTFHFVTGGIAEALARAKAAAGERDVRIGGGVATVRAFLEAGLVDEMHLVISPVVLGAGEPLLAGLDLAAMGYTVARRQGTDAAMHVVLQRG